MIVGVGVTDGVRLAGFVGVRIDGRFMVDVAVAVALDVRGGDGVGVSEDLAEIVDVRVADRDGVVENMTLDVAVPVGDGVGVVEDRDGFASFRVGDGVGVSADVTVAVGVRVGEVLYPSLGPPAGVGTPSKTTLGSIDDSLSADEGSGVVDGVNPSCGMTNKRGRMARNQ